MGLDLGQLQDYSALAIAEVQGDSKESRVYDVRHLQRFKLGTTYPQMVEDVKELITIKPLKGKTRLVLDLTGVGKPVFSICL
jgi:hypothetical protein